jgi:hypothetical protein
MCSTTRLVPGIGRLGLLVPSMGPTPLRGASLRLSNFVPDKIVERWFASCAPSQHKTPPLAGFCVGWETRIDFVSS